MNPIALDKFVNNFQQVKSQVVGKDLVEKYQNLLPGSLLELWEKVGIGKYGNGLIELINPDDYKSLLYGWLMFDEEDETRLPIALSPFGTIFYYRRLTDTDEDVAAIDPHYRSSDVLVWSLEDFFNEFMCDSQSVGSVINETLYNQACNEYGNLANGEIFYFNPALSLGGEEKVECIGKGDAQIHLDLLLQIALG